MSSRETIAAVCTVALGVVLYFILVAGASPDLLSLLFVGFVLVIGWYDLRFLLVGWFLMSTYFYPYPDDLAENASVYSITVNYASNVSHYQFIPLMFFLFVLRSILTGKRLNVGKEEIVMIIFIISSVISSVVATKGEYADVRRIYVTYGLGLLVYYVVKNMDLDLRLFKAFGFVALFHVGALLCIGIYEYQTGLSFYTKALRFVDVGYGRIAGPFLTPIALGIFLPMNFLFIYQAQKLGLLPRLALWIGGAVTGFLTILTFTRSVWLGAFVTILFVMYRSSEEGAAKVVRLALFAVVGIGLVGMLAMNSPEIEKRLTGEENANFRLAMAHASVNMFLDKPIFGWGFGTFDLFKEKYLMDAYGFYMSNSKETSHVTLLTILAEQGVFGASLLILFIYFSVSFKGMKMTEFSGDARLLAAANIGALITLVINAFLVDIKFFPLTYAWSAMNLGFIHNIYRTNQLKKLGADETSYAQGFIRRTIP